MCVKVTPGEITVVNLLNDADLTAQAAKKSGIKKTRNKSWFLDRILNSHG